MHRVHHFWTSSEAKDASIAEGAVREGDVLVVIAERVVGLASTDPIAVTVATGALRDFPALSRDQLLEELVHDEAAIGSAVDEAVRHGLPVARQYQGFGNQPRRRLGREAQVEFSLDDIAVVADAIDHRIASLHSRAATVPTDDAHGLFLQHVVDRLGTARERLAAYTRTPSQSPIREM